MPREFFSGIQHAEVATLPAAAANPRVTLVQGGKLWFSDGSAWVDLGAAGGGGGAVDYTVVTAGQTLADDAPLLAVITTPQTFPAPASPTVGDEYVLRNHSTSTAIASFDPGAGRQVTYGAGQSLPVADTLTIAPGEQAALIVRSSTTFELNTPGAVGPAGPPGGGTTVLSGTATITITEQLGAFEWVETVTATGVTPSMRVTVALAGVPDSAENDAEMLEILGLAAIPLTGQITVVAAFDTPTSGPISLNWSAI